MFRIIYRKRSSQWHRLCKCCSRNDIEDEYYLTMFRISAHKLFIEKGRHSGIVRYNRLCKCCSRNDIEDAYHFILVCSCYLDLRQKLTKNFYFYKPSVLSS